MNEDDTFRKLKQRPFAEVNEALCRITFHRRGSWHKERLDTILNAGWTVEEWADELKREG